MRNAFILIIFTSLNVVGQNNAIFGGGDGDGFSNKHETQDFILPINNFVFGGGDGNIYTSKEYEQRYNLPSYSSIFNGGNGNGFNNNGIEQVYNLPSNNSIYGGGNGDVFDNGEYQQSYVLPSNTSIFGGGTGSGDIIGCLLDTPSYLPVNLLSFAAIRLSNSDVNLKWETSFEYNNLGFELWRKTYGDWSEIDFVEGRSPSQAKQNYSIVDQNNPAEISYYKLKQLDFDGVSYKWSEIRVVGNTTTSFVSIYPNPTNLFLQVESNSFEPKEIIILNSLGVPVSILPKPSKIQQLDTRYLRKGIYTIKIVGENKTITKTFVKI